MSVFSDTQSLADFAQHPSDVIDQLRLTGRPVVLTVNGQAEVVVQDVQAYRKLLECIERAETVAGIRRGLEDITAGRTQPAREAIEELRLKYEVPR